MSEQPGGGTQVIERTDARPQAGGGDSAHRAHIVKRPDKSQGASAWITEARVMGLEVEALCGYRWIPARDPEKYPVCEACRDILSNMPV